MANPEEFDSVGVLNMLKAFRLALSKGEVEVGDADFVGTTLETNLKEKFDRSRPSSRFSKKEHKEAERKRIDRTFLVVREANQAVRAGLMDLALGLIDDALELWSKAPATRTEQ